MAAYFAAALATQFAYVPAPFLLLIVVGAIGAVIAALVMDWAIIVLSALAGSAAVVSVLGLRPPMEALTFSVLAVAGVLVQYSVLKRRRRLIN